MNLRAHPLNRSFEWVDRTGPFRRLSEEQVKAYDELGFVILEDVIEASTVEQLKAEIDPYEEKVEEFLQTQDGGRAFIAQAGAITFVPHLVVRSSALRDFCAGSVFRDLVHDLIGPDVRLYWEQAVYKKPEPDRDFPWHQDNGYTYVTPQTYLTCWVALTDATLENGCPWVAPALHRRGTLEHWMTDLGWRCLAQPEKAVPAPVRAGGIVVLSSLTPHRTGPNRTRDVRKAYIVQFAPEGAAVVRPDGTPEPCNHPDRQYPILVGGEAP